MNPRKNIMMSQTFHLTSSIDKDAAARLSDALKKARGIHTVDIPPDGKQVRVIYDDALTSAHELSIMTESALYATSPPRASHGAGGCCGGCS